MKRAISTLSAVILAVFFLWIPAAPCASAAGGTDVWVNNVYLSTGSPYWKNGDLPASADDWNAYYDDSTSTLTLKDAVITNAYTAPSGAALIFADGPLHLVLTGASTLSRTETVSPTLNGVCALGALTVSGSGSLEIALSDPVALSTVSGLVSADTITVNAGSQSINIGGRFTFGLSALFGLVIAGGDTEIEANGSEQSILLYVDNGGFRMSGGTFWGAALSDVSAAGIASLGVVFTGGEGEFYAQSAGFAVGLFNLNPVLYVSGGHFKFAGDTWALTAPISSSDPLDLRLNNVKTYVSETADSFAKRLWTSEADGRLVTTIGNFSPFLYAEFQGTGITAAPQTGDVSRPWLWAGIALLSLLGAAGLAAARRKRSGETKHHAVL